MEEPAKKALPVDSEQSCATATLVLEPAVPGNICALRVPERDLRLLTEGLRNWLSRLSHRGPQEPRLLGLLEGESGVRQTETLRAFGQTCRDLGMQVVWGRSFAYRTFPPGACNDLALGCLALAEAPGSATVTLSPEIRAELLSAVGKPTETESPVPTLGPELDHSRRVDSLARAHLELSGRSPLIVLVDQLSDADSLTRDTIGHLLRLLAFRSRCADLPRVLVVATVAPGFEASSLGEGVPRTEEICAFRARTRGVIRDELRSQAIEVLGEDVPLSIRERLLHDTGGDARHLQWLLWSIRELGGIRNPGAAARATDFESIVRDRYQRLSTNERAIVALASAWTVPFDAALILAEEVPAATPGASEFERLQALVAAGWLEAVDVRTTASLGDTSTGGPAFCIVAPEVARAILASLSLEERRELLGKAASRVRSSCTRSSTWLPLAARLFREAAEWSACVECVLGASIALEAMGCFEAALALLEENCEAIPAGASGVNRAQVQLRRAELLVLTGNFQEAIEAYKGLISASVDLEEQSRLWRLVGELYGRLGDQESRLRAHGEGLRLLAGTAGSLERLKTLAAIAKAHLEVKEIDQSLGYLDQCLEVIADQGLAADVEYLELYRLAEEMHFHRADYVEAAEFEQCLLARCEATGDVRGQLQSLRHLAHLTTLKDDWQSADVYLTRGLKVAKGSGSRWLYALALVAMGRQLRARRQPRSALKTLRRAIFLLSELGKLEMVERIQGVLAGLELELGHFDAAARSIAAFLCNGDVAVGAVFSPAVLDVREVEPAERRHWIRRMEKKSARGGAQLEGNEVLRLVSSLAVDGRLVDACSVARAALKRDWSSRPEAAAELSFLLARFSVLGGDLDGALARLEGALQGGVEKPRLDVLARAYLEASRVLLMRGDVARAFEYLSKGCRCIFDTPSLPGLCAALGGFAAFALETGFYPAALTVSECFLALAQGARYPTWEIAAIRCLGRAQAGIHGGQVPEATVRQWSSLVEKLEAPEESVIFNLEMGWAAYYQGSFERALTLAREAIELARKVGFSSALDELLHLVGVVESAARNPRKNFLRALEALEQALAGAESRRRHRLRWEILRDVAEIYRERNKDDLAEAYVARAREIEIVALGSLPPQLSALHWLPRRGELATVLSRA